MRLTIFIFLIGSGILISIIRPYIGLLVFSLLSYMRPQNFLWGVEGLRFSYYVAIAMIIGCMLQKEKLFLKERENIIMLFLLIIFILSTIFAIYPILSSPKLLEISKIILIAILTSALVNSKKRFKFLAWTIVLCLGIIAVKGALRGIFLGWQLRGPADSMIADNNDLALALNMTLPFFIYLGINETKKAYKWLFFLCFPLVVIAIIYTFSRGGFIGLCAVSFLLAAKAKKKILGFTILTLGIILFMNFAPQEHKERMQTIKTYEQDESAMGRIYAWKAAWAMAKDRPLTGVGIGKENFLLVFSQYNSFSPRVAHNSYLQILADSGFIALGLFLLLLYFSIKKLRNLRRKFPLNEKNVWAHNYSHMLEIGFIGYMISGFFLSRADFDLMYQFVGMTVALDWIVRKENKNAQLQKS